MLLTTRLELCCPRRIYASDNHLRSRQLLDQRVSLHMIRMRVTCNQNFDVAELESQSLHILLDYRDGCLVVAVHQDQTLGSGEQEGCQLLGSHVIEVIHDLVRWEGIVPTRGRSSLRKGQHRKKRQGDRQQH